MQRKVKLGDRNSFLDTKTAKIFDDKTLIGNWFENRAVIEKASPAAQKTQEPQSTEYSQNYANALKENALSEIFSSSYVQAFRNRARANHSSVKFFNANQFLTNLSSTNDIYFRIKTGRDRCGRIVSEPTTTLGFDPLDSFGNSTKFGLRTYIRDREKKKRDEPTDISFTRNFYKCPRKGDYAHIVKKKKKKTELW